MTKRNRKWLAVLAFAPALALGQIRTEREEWLRDRDVSVKAQGGMLTYTDESAALTAPGASYGVLVGFDLTRLWQAELSYQGAAYATDDDLPFEQDTILENGGQGILLVAPDIGRFEPYALGGIGVSRFTVLEGATPNPAVDSATLVKVPVGVGAQYHAPVADGETAFTVGARTLFDFIVAGDPFPTLVGGLPTQFQTTLQLGATF